MDFKQFCEDEIFQPWINGKNIFDNFKDYEIEYLPEPYYVVEQNNNKDKDCLYVLNNNPGDVLTRQHIDEIKKNFKGKNYEEISKDFSNWYQKNLTGAAKRRLDKMKKFCLEMGFDGIENLETFFLHSKSMNKSVFLKKYANTPIVKGYTNALNGYLKDKVVLVITAVGSRQSIDLNYIKGNDFLEYQANHILGVDLQKLKIETIIKKAGKVTAAYAIQNKKIFVFMMGSNNLPNFSNDIIESIRCSIKSN